MSIIDFRLQAALIRHRQAEHEKWLDSFEGVAIGTPALTTPSDDDQPVDIPAMTDPAVEPRVLRRLGAGGWWRRLDWLAVATLAAVVASGVLIIRARASLPFGPLGTAGVLAGLAVACLLIASGTAGEPDNWP